MVSLFSSDVIFNFSNAMLISLFIIFLNNSFDDLLKVSVLNIQSSSLFIDYNSLFDYHRLT